MNNKLYGTIIDINKIILNFLTAYIIICSYILLSTKDYSAALYALWLFPAPIISNIIYTYTKHKWTFIVCHLLLFLAYALITEDSFLRTVFCLFIVALTVHRLAIKNEQDKNASMVFASIFFVFTTYSSLFIENFKFTAFYFSLALIYIFLFIINMYLINYKKYFEIYVNVDNIPINQIKQKNTILILLFVVFCLLLMCVFSVIPLNEFLSYIGRLIKNLLPTFHITNNKNTNIETDTSAVTHKLEEIIKPSQTGLDDFFAKMVILLRFPVTLILIVFAIYKIIQLYRKKEKSKNKKTEYIMPSEKREKIEIKPVINIKRIAILFNKTNNDKIRKLFYKAVLSHMGSNQKFSKDITPSQLSKYALMNESNNVSDTKTDKILTDYYEKARYSQQECSKEDVQAVRDMLRCSDRRD